MSIPTSDEAALKDYLFDHDEQFRVLANEHRKYEARLVELAELHFPNEEEQLEETVLKKKKLVLKDQMETITSRYRASAVAS